VSYATTPKTVRLVILGDFNNDHRRDKPDSELLRTLLSGIFSRKPIERRETRRPKPCLLLCQPEVKSHPSTELTA
jgi:hypothetical protein